MKTPFLLLFSLMLISGFVLAATPPQLPMIISGNVSINNHPAKIGTEIIALVGGEKVSETKISEAGKFSLLLQKLDEGQEVNFYVDKIDANQTISYKSGDFEQLSLKVDKSYLGYYLGVAVLLIAAGFLIWRQKSIFGRKKR